MEVHRVTGHYDYVGPMPVFHKPAGGVVSGDGQPFQVDS
jgi:hypothetical protein